MMWAFRDSILQLYCLMLQQNQAVVELQETEGEVEFSLKRHIKKKEAEMLIFLYNAHSEPTFESFDQKIALYTELKKHQQKVTLKTEQVRREFHALSEKLHNKIMREDSECEKQLNRLQTSWQNQRIEYFHRFVVQKFIYSTYLKSIATLIKNQQHLIKHEQHIYYSIQRAVRVRQTCRTLIQKETKALEPSNMYEHFHIANERQIERGRRMQQKSYKIHGFRARLRLDEKEINLNRTKIEELFQMIANYRQLTYNLIELVKNWKMYILSLTHDLKLRKEKLSFYHQENNILLLLLNDTSFFSTSFLSNFYHFSLRNDPFLLKPIFYLQKKEETALCLTPEERQLKRLINIRPSQVVSIISGIRQLYFEMLSYSNSHRLFQRRGLTKMHMQSQKQLIYNGEDLRRNQELEMAKIKGTMARQHSELYPKNPLLKRQAYSKQPSRLDQKDARMIKSKSQKLQLRPIQQYHPSQKDRQSSFQKNKSSILARKQSIALKPLSTFYLPKSRKTNPEERLLQFDDIKNIKEEVYRKVKEEFEYETKRQLLQNPKFQEMIDGEIRSKMHQMISQDGQRTANEHLEITPLSFSQQEIKSFIGYAYKQIPYLLAEMQIAQPDLIKKITEIQYCYILKVHNKFGEISNVIATINREITEYKSIEIQLISFRQKESVEKIILKVVEFFWKYENCKEVIVGFKHSVLKREERELIDMLKAKLNLNCHIIDKHSSNLVNHKFIFIRNHLQDHLYFNPHPHAIFFQLYAILATQPLQQTNNHPHHLEHSLYYDFVILQILRKYTNSEDFLVLRSNFSSKDRFWHLINQILVVEDIQNEKVKVECIEAQNITELNYKLRTIKKPTLEASDINTFNSIRMIQIEYSLTIAFQLKVLANQQGQRYHRYAVRDRLQYMMDAESTQFYKLPVKELQHLKILIFSAASYQQHHTLGLNMYLLETLQQNKKRWSKKHTENLWIEMLQFPSKGGERQQHYLNTSRCLDFKSIKKDLLMGDRFEWFTDIQIQNGIAYRLKEGDICLKKPLGVGVITNKNILIYARILGE